jgi:hypothetical protein
MYATIERSWLQLNGRNKPLTLTTSVLWPVTRSSVRPTEVTEARFESNDPFPET